MRHYADISGNYVGHLNAETAEISGFIEVPDPNITPTQVWDGTKYVDPLVMAIKKRLIQLSQEYMIAISKPIMYTSFGGITEIFQADATSQYNLLAMTTAYANGTPNGFYWVANNNVKVPFTIEDIKGLANVVGNQGWNAFQNVQLKKVEIMNATSIEALNAITWE